MRGEELMTDEQFEMYNELLEMTDRMIQDLPEDKKKEYIQQRKDILLRNKN
jgi:hypothetical protein